MKRIRNIKTTERDLTSLVVNFERLIGRLASVAGGEAMQDEIAVLGACSEQLLAKLTNVSTDIDDGEYFAICRIVRELVELKKLISGYAEFQHEDCVSLNLQSAR